MITKLRRIVLLIAISSGIIAATAVAADAAMRVNNHCKPRLAESQH